MYLIKLLQDVWTSRRSPGAEQVHNQDPEAGGAGAEPNAKKDDDDVVDADFKEVYNKFIRFIK